MTIHSLSTIDLKVQQYGIACVVLSSTLLTETAIATRIHSPFNTEVLTNLMNASEMFTKLLKTFLSI